MTEGIILQKYIAESGLCSRRKAEELIKSGKIFINHNIAFVGARVKKGDRVEVLEGKKKKILMIVAKKRYIIFNKPAGLVCTKAVFKNEKNIFSVLPFEFSDLQIVGRLDKNSHGLVILTNDGDWANKMTHPRYEHEKEYIIKIKTKGTKIAVDKIFSSFFGGINIGDEDGIVRAKEIKEIKKGIFRIILTEGKKRQIRRMFKEIGLEVEDLKRVRVGKIELGDLKEGEWREIKVK